MVWLFVARGMAWGNITGGIACALLLAYMGHPLAWLFLVNLAAGLFVLPLIERETRR